MSEVGIDGQEGGLEILDGGLITETVRRLILEGSLVRCLFLSKRGGNICPIGAHLFPHLCKDNIFSRGTGRAR